MVRNVRNHHRISSDMSRAFTGPGFYQIHKPITTRPMASEFFGRMESPGHATTIPVIGAKMMYAGFTASTFNNSAGRFYNATEMAAKVTRFNSEMVGGYGTDPMNMSDLSANNIGTVKETTDQAHWIWFGRSSGVVIQQSLFDTHNPVASYFFYESQGNGYSIQGIRVASTIPNYIIVRMLFDYDGSGHAVNFRNFTLYDSGTLDFGDAITIPVPVPALGSEFDDPLTGNINLGFAHVAFFGMSWTTFQDRYV
jgi:hypothetical protein